MRVKASVNRIVTAIAATGLIAPARAQFVPPPAAVYIPPMQTFVPSPIAPAEDQGEETYADGVRLWQNGQFDQAEKVLRDFVDRFPDHPRSSFANYLLGRTLLDTGRPTQAAVVLWENYRENPKGGRAAESLFYYSQALLSQPDREREHACRLYDDIEKRYKATLSDALTALLRDARMAGHCAGAPATAQAAQNANAHQPPVAALPSISTHERRVALVVGNGAYNPSLGELANPLNDAKLVAEVLRRAGFDVQMALNLDQKGMKAIVSQFGQRLAKAGKGSVGLFYYAGHGLQIQGVNYLLPVDAVIRSEADVDLNAVSADSILAQMDLSGSTNIVILDACRNTPVFRRFRGIQRGLAIMKTPPSPTYISYSTAPGAVAADGEGPNSPFAEALVAELPTRGEQIESTFRNVRRAVLQKTNGQQIPWEASSLVNPFVFFPNR